MERTVVPILYQKDTNKVGEAHVDPELLPFLNRFKWYISDTRRPRPPKTVLRTKDGGVHFLLLNRVVYLLSLKAKTDQQRLLEDYEALVAELDLVPRIYFRNKNQFDCRLENLEAKVKAGGPTAQRLKALHITAIPRTASEAEILSRDLSQDPDLDLSPGAEPESQDESELDILDVLTPKVKDTSQPATARNTNVMEGEDYEP